MTQEVELQSEAKPHFCKIHLEIPRFLFEKTFPTCLTLAHLQGALSADTVYMELLQVLGRKQARCDTNRNTGGRGQAQCCGGHLWDLCPGAALPLSSAARPVLPRGRCRPADGADQGLPRDHRSQGQPDLFQSIVKHILWSRLRQQPDPTLMKPAIQMLTKFTTMPRYNWPKLHFPEYTFTF